jgi:hypothetical protein
MRIGPFEITHFTNKDFLSIYMFVNLFQMMKYYNNKRELLKIQVMFESVGV